MGELDKTLEFYLDGIDAVEEVLEDYVDELQVTQVSYEYSTIYQDIKIFRLSIWDIKIKCIAPNIKYYFYYYKEKENVD